MARSSMATRFHELGGPMPDVEGMLGLGVGPCLMFGWGLGLGAEGGCTVRSNASWVMVTWRPTCGKTDTLL